jgi:cobalamin biosynthetic protein CobC
MLDHGGNLQLAVQRYGRPHEDWLDLSTGINPHAYPVPALPPDVWYRLPEANDALLQAARSYYGALPLLPVAGTQAVIQTLPRLRTRARIAVAAPSYREHAHRWTLAGHAVHEVPYARLAAAVDVCDVMIVCNPNNPTGETVAPEILLRWAARLAARGGWLIVDEAFADASPKLSVTAFISQAELPPGLILLRSIGKFFGLAGLRLGFVVAQPDLLARLNEAIGPWTVSTPAQRIGAVALADTSWQDAMRNRLLFDGHRLKELLAMHGIASIGCALFQYWPEARPEDHAACMAQHGVWVRQFTHGVRLGLPGDESGWRRLDAALRTWSSFKEKR